MSFYTTTTERLLLQKIDFRLQSLELGNDKFILFLETLMLALHQGAPGKTEVINRFLINLS